MIDVFIRVAPQSAVRCYIAAAVYERWKMDPLANVRVIASSPNNLSFYATGEHGIIPEYVLNEKDFCWSSRRYAEANANGPFYILTDDDHLILVENWVKRAVSQIEKKNFTVMASATSVIRGEFSTEMDCRGGCPCIIRRRYIDWKRFSGPANQQDTIISEHIRKEGYTQSYLSGVDYLHCGFGLSQVEPRCWLTY